MMGTGSWQDASRHGTVLCSPPAHWLNFFAAVRPGSPSLHLGGREALIYGRYVACERIAIHVFLPVR